MDMNAGMRARFTGFLPNRDQVTAQAYARVRAFADDFRSDPELRSRVAADPRGVLAERNLGPLPEVIGEEVEIRFVANTDDKYFLVFPPDPNIELTDDTLLDIAAGGKTASTAGTSGSAATIASTVTTSTASSASSVSSAGSAGSTG